MHAQQHENEHKHERWLRRGRGLRACHGLGIPSVDSTDGNSVAFLFSGMAICLGSARARIARIPERFEQSNAIVSKPPAGQSALSSVGRGISSGWAGHGQVQRCRGCKGCILYADVDKELARWPEQACHFVVHQEQQRISTGSRRKLVCVGEQGSGCQRRVSHRQELGRTLH